MISIALPAKLLQDTTTREEVEGWCLAQIKLSGQADFDLDYFFLDFEPDDDDSYIINIWGPTDLDGLCPLVATINLFNNHLQITEATK